MENNRDKKYRYLNGLMSPKEENIFLHEVEGDAYLKEELSFEINTQKAIHRNERAQLKSYLQSLDIPEQSQRPVWSIAAAIVVFILASFAIILYVSKDSASEKLYAEYFQAYPNIIAPNVRGDQSEKASLEAFVHYDLENYAYAAELFDRLYKETHEPYALLYCGISYLADGQASKAIHQLKQVEHYSEIAQWYLALAYLKSDQTKYAKEILLQLADQETEFTPSAEELLQKL